MNVARILYPVKVLGPGNRLGIWLAGCPRRCEGCSNPELWEKQSRYEIPVERLLRLVAPVCQRADGVTITGGDPFWQAEALTALLEGITAWTRDILVYTGYDKQELDASENPAVHSCLDKIGVLIDGPYNEARNDGTRLRGSANQGLFILRKSLAPKYKAYLSQGENQIQNFMTKDGMVSVGIHRPGFQQDIIRAAEEKGVIIHE